MAGDDDDERVTKRFGSDIVQKDAAKQIVTVPVLVPDEADRHGDVVEAANIEKVAYDYLSTHLNVDEMHDRRDRAENVPVESWIVRADVEIGDSLVKAGTWMASLKLGDAAWAKVQDGTYRGVSIEGAGRRRSERDRREQEASD